MNVDDYLHNWVLYLRSLPIAGPVPDSTCRSIEHRFIPEAGEVFEEEKKEEVYFDKEQGELIEKIVCDLPQKYKTIVVSLYIKYPYLSKSQIAKKLKMDKYNFDKTLYLAKQLIKKGINNGI